MKKTIIALGLTLALTLTPALAAGVEDKFPAKNEYPGYADVADKDWFYQNAKLCFEVGLMNGSDKGFEPGKVMQVSELVAVTARVREAITGELIVLGTPLPGQTLPWYHFYGEYLKDAGVALPENLEAQATREQFLKLLSAVLPEDTLSPINTITQLPDTTDAVVLKFYNAGILTGTDSYGTFQAGKTLTRAEAAAMLSRVVREELRTAFTPADYTPFTAAECKPTDVFFQGNGKSVTAGAYLASAMAVIADLESACAAQGIEFNWNNTETASGLTFKEYLRQSVMSDLEVTRAMGTEQYANFDIQVFYSRYLDLTK